MTHRVTIGGKPYDIAFTMGAWRVLEEEEGASLSTLKAHAGAGESQQQASALVTLLCVMLRAADPELSRRNALDILAGVQPEEIAPAVAAATDCIREAMAVRSAGESAGEAWDPLLARLDAKASEREQRTITWRRAAGLGLIAGIPLHEQDPLAPGLVVELFTARQAYDDAQHGITRKAKDDAPIDEGVDWDTLTGGRNEDKGS